MTHRQASGQSAERFAALNRVGIALMSELDETRLLHMIAETACELTDATFAAFTLRPVDEVGQPRVPSEGNLFQLAAVVGVTEEQEELFRHMSPGGEGLLAPIFREGIPVLIADALSYVHTHTGQDKGAKKKVEQTKDTAFAFSHGVAPGEGLRSIGVPRGHPVVRSFLGAPLLDREKRVHGGLLLGHTEPNRFTAEDKALLAGLAAKAQGVAGSGRARKCAHVSHGPDAGTGVERHLRKHRRWCDPGRSAGDYFTRERHSASSARAAAKHLRRIPKGGKLT